VPVHRAGAAKALSTATPMATRELSGSPGGDGLAERPGRALVPDRRVPGPRTPLSWRKGLVADAEPASLNGSPAGGYGSGSAALVRKRTALLDRRDRR
jgi:hypothetical protein